MINIGRWKRIFSLEKHRRVFTRDSNCVSLRARITGRTPYLIRQTNSRQRMISFHFSSRYSTTQLFLTVEITISQMRIYFVFNQYLRSWCGQWRKIEFFGFSCALKLSTLFWINGTELLTRINRIFLLRRIRFNWIKCETVVQLNTSICSRQTTHPFWMITK